MSKVTVLLLCAFPFALGAQEPERPRLDWSGLLFGNFQVQLDDAARTGTGGPAADRFDVGRAYLTVNAPAGERTSIRVTTDIFQNSADDYYSGWSMRLKYAYLEYDLTSPDKPGDVDATAVVGMLPTVVISQVESYWPRFLINTALELSGFFGTSDVGVATRAGLPGEHGEVYATLTNGSGYTSAETDRFKDAAIRISYTPFPAATGALRDLTITPWYYKGFRASDFVLGGPGQVGAVSDGLRHDRMGIFAGIKSRSFTLGADFGRRMEDVEAGANTALSPRTVASRTSTLTSGFVLLRPLDLIGADSASRLGLVARYDSFTPDDDAPGRNAFVVTGVTWDVNRNVAVAIDYQELSARNGSTALPTRTWFLHWTASF